MMYGISVFKVFVVMLICIVPSYSSVIITHADKYAGATPCEDDSDCDHLLNSTCEEVFCVCNGSKFCEDLTKRVVTKVGETCNYDDECNIDNAECNDNTCACKSGFIKSAIGKRCLNISEGLQDSCEENIQCYTKTPYSICQENKCVCQQHTHMYNGSCVRSVELGQSCVNNQECSLTELAECKDSKCVCIEKHVESTRGSRCLLVTDGIQSYCVDDAQCKKSLGSNSHCNQGICECSEMYQLKNATNKCVRDMLLGDICGVHSDCREPFNRYSRLECILGVCKCKSFYVEFEGYCISSSQYFKASVVIVIISHILISYSQLL